MKCRGGFALERVVGADVVDDLLEEGDADVDAAGDVGEELADEGVGWVGGEADDDALGGGGGAGLNSRDIQVGELGGSGVGEEGGVVGHGGAVVVLADYGVGEGVKDAAAGGGSGYAVVAGVLVSEGGDEPCAEEFPGGVLREREAVIFAEALESGAVGALGVGGGVDGGGEGDDGEVAGVGKVGCGEEGFLARGEGDGDLVVEEALIGEEEGALLLDTRVTAEIGIGIPECQVMASLGAGDGIAGGFKGYACGGDDILLLGEGGAGGVRKCGGCGIWRWRLGWSCRPFGGRCGEERGRLRVCGGDTRRGEDGGDGKERREEGPANRQTTSSLGPMVLNTG